MDRITRNGPLGGKLVRLEEHPRLILRGATILDGTGRAFQDGVLVVEKERVAAVGPAGQVALPAESDFEVWDLAGRAVMPGMMDAHVHFTGDRSFNPYERYMPTNGSYHSFLAALDAHRTLEAGFTTVRNLGHGPAERVYGLKRAINEGVLLGPRILTAGWAFSQSGGHGNVRAFPSRWVQEALPRSAFADGVDGCRKAVRLNFGEGADLVKIYTTEGSYSRGPGGGPAPNYTIPEIEAMADEAHRRGAKIATHASSAEGARIAVLGGIDTVEHGDGLGQDPATIQLMIERRTILVPTFSVFHHLANDGPKFGSPPPQVARCRRALEGHFGFVGPAFRAGLRIAVGTDTGNTVGVGDNALELQLLVEAGLTPMEAIVAATRTASEALGLESHLGTLEPGKLAELLVLERNPLEGIAVLRDKANLRWIFKSSQALA